MSGVEAFKKSFFDRAAVADKIPPAIKKALSKFGAFTRRRSRSSIRKRKAVSKPGKPPTDRTGGLRNILFAYEPMKRSVVIGPVIFQGAKQPHGAELLEYGGTAAGNGRTIFVTRDPGRDATGKFVTKGRQKVKLDGTLTYKARPYMRPAFGAELEKIGGDFKNLIAR